MGEQGAGTTHEKVEPVKGFLIANACWLLWLAVHSWSMRPAMTNDAIIQETRRCESKGLWALPFRNEDGTIYRVQCQPSMKTKTGR